MLRLLTNILVIATLCRNILATSESFFALDDFPLPPEPPGRQLACKRHSAESGEPLPSYMSNLPKELVSSIFEKADLHDYKLLLQISRDFHSLLTGNNATILAIIDKSDQKVREHFFWKAVAQGSAKAVGVFLESPHIDAGMYDNFAIIVAAQEGFYDIVKMLLSRNDVDPTVDENQPIRLAAGYGQARVVELLLKDKRVNPSDQNNDAIREAIRCGKFKVVQAFLANTRYEPPKNLLYLAAKYNQANLVKFLLKDRRFQPRWYNNAAIRAAANGGFSKILQLLLQDKRANPAAMDNDAIFRAASKGHFDIVKLLLQDARVKPSARHNAPLYNAAYHGHNAIVRILLRQKEVTSAGGFKKIFQAALFNDEIDIAREIMQKINPPSKASYQAAISIVGNQFIHFRAQADKVPRTSDWWSYYLSLSARYGNIALLQEVLRMSKVNPAAHDNLALRIAAEHGKGRIVSFLLSDRRVNPAAVENAAIKLATMNGWSHVVEELLEDPLIDIYDSENAGENANYEDIYQGRNDEGHYPAILIASQHGHYEIVEMLLLKSVADGRTVGFSDSLYAACVSGHLDIAKLIRDHQAPIWDEIVVAAHYGQTDIVQLLIKDYREPLHLNNALYEASKSGHEDVVHILIGNVNYTQDALATARSFALKYCQYQIVSILEDVN